MMDSKGNLRPGRVCMDDGKHDCNDTPNPKVLMVSRM